MAIDVTDETFQTDVVDRSNDAVVVVDLWAPWCGPCKTLTPILEQTVASTGGKAILAKVNVDENPAISQAFRVQSIPAVYALKGGQVVDGFMGALPEHEVRQFIDRLLPSESESMVAAMVAMGDEGSLRAALEVDPANEDAIVALAEQLIARGDTEEALALLRASPRPIAPGWWPPRLGWAPCRPTTITMRRSPSCSIASRTTTRRASSSSTSSS